MNMQRWSREVVTQEIQKLAEQGNDLRHSEVSAKHQKLVSAAVRYFGSWGSAVTAAGIDYASIRRQSQEARSAKVTKWTMESIAEKIQELVASGESLAAATVRERFPALFSAAVSPRYYGSWRSALTSIGLDYDAILAQNRSTSTAPRDARGMRTVMRRLHALGDDAKRLSGAEAQARYPRLCERVLTHFDSWEAALAAAFGFKTQ